MCLWLVYTQTLHEPAVLLRGQRPCLAFLPGPLEAAGFQTLVQQYKPVAFPVQRFDSIPASAAEEEQGVGKWIQVKLLLYKSGQSVNPASQVSIAAGDIDPVGTGKVAQHNFKIRSTVSTVAASAPE